MSLSLSFLRKAVTYCSLASVFSLSCFADASYAPNGGEYAIIGPLPTDQVHPRLALTSGGGFIVWEDAVTDGEGLGVSAMALGPGLSGNLSPFRVNEVGSGDQEKPQIALLKGGGAVFVWQGGKMGFQHIFARFLSANNTWVAGDIAVSSFNQSFQTYPSVATLVSGNVVVVWSSYNQRTPTSMQDVYGQILSPTGEKIGGEFTVNQVTAANQRTPVVAALANGGFVVAWVSELQRGGTVDNPDPNYQYGPSTRPSVDIYARMFTASGSSSGSEFLVNESTQTCANPCLASSAEGFLVAWGERDLQILENRWDVFARTFTTSGTPGAASRVNTVTVGDQLAPQASASGSDYLVVWTSVGQDGSREGVYAQFLKNNGAASGSEFRVNTTTVSQQIHPAVASDGAGQFLATWSSFVGGASSFDLYAQRYVDAGQPLVAMNAPYVNVPFNVVNGTYQPEIGVSWASQDGLAIDHYEVYVNGAAAPAASVNANVWIMAGANGLKADTTATFQVAYVTADGRRSPRSPAASAKTWTGYNWGGVPFEWMTENYGTDISTWPSAATQLETGGPTVLQTFVSGGNPRSPASWLRTKLEATSQGMFLTWNPKPGLIYQVQSSKDLVSWQNVGGQRMALGALDSLHVSDGNSCYYRVVLQR